MTISFPQVVADPVGQDKITQTNFHGLVKHIQ